MHIRVFGSHDCEKCQAISGMLEALPVAYEFVDAARFDDESINQLCDEHNVEALPHVQFLDDKFKVVDEMKGDILPGHVLTKLEDLKATYGGPSQHHEI